MDNDDFFEGDKPLEIPAGALHKLTTCVQQVVGHDNRIAEIEAELKAAKAERLLLVQRTVPEALNECGIASFETTDGHVVRLKKVIDAHITVKNREAAQQWLIDNGYEDLIKNNITVALTKGQHNMAAAIAADLREKYQLSPEVKQSIHPQTFKAFVRERVEAGDQLPEKLLGIYTAQVAEITTK